MSEDPLPEICLITPEPAEYRNLDDFLATLSHVLSGGVELVQLRSKRLDPQAYLTLAQQVRALCRAQGARLILNGPPPDVTAGVGDGVHLGSARLMSCTSRPAGARLVSAACHSAAELAQAERIGVDFVTLSPVLHTASHPETEAMGWERFAELVSNVRIPVYALGGMATHHVGLARQCGAQGIAAISALWRVSA